jgi:tellurium resistance protein TerD
VFCHKCGNQIDESSLFCDKCGTGINQADPLCASGINNANRLVCPKCGGSNLNSVIKPKVSGGNSASDACCGYALLGPLGLLCGLHKTNVDNQTFWICQDCGEQFRDAREASQQLFSYGIAFIVVGGFMLWAQIESDLWWPLWIFGIGLVSFGIAFIALWKKSKP